MPDRYTLYALAGYYVASAAVSSLPPPKDADPAWYHWFYKFSNMLMANVTAIRGKALYEPKMQVVSAESTATSLTVSSSQPDKDK